MRVERILLAELVALALACSSDSTSPKRVRTPEESALRAKLGIPPDATSILIFGQNSHLDVDWQKTFDDYYGSFVGDIFIEARKLLEGDPRAYYGIAEMAYLQHHIEVHPEELAPLRAQVARGSLRIIGGGMTSPDTLLPESELLFRDFLYGSRFAEDTMGSPPPVAAWLPDSFGHSATAPDVLTAAGYSSVAFSRIDGAATILERIVHRDAPPKPGSTAEKLIALGSDDFEWTGAGGSKILAHYMSGFGLYCQGDNIDYDEALQVPGGHSGTLQTDPSFMDGRIDGYVKDLQPQAKTPYMFVPVGCDFQHPKTQLLSYVDGYNLRRYPTTHVWAVAAPFDDYAKLVGYWSDVLPTVSGDLSPYFMGFYGSRADVKRNVRAAARPFFVAETFAAALGDQGRALVALSAPALSKLARADHHDFVTGTAADPVAQQEQLPLLDEASTAGRSELFAVAATIASHVASPAGALHRLLALNASSATRDEVVDVAIPLVGGAPAMHAVAGGKDVPMEIVGAPSASSETLRISISALPPFAYREIDLLPGAAAAPAPAVSLALTDANGVAATGSAVTRVVLSNANVKVQWDKRLGVFGITSLVVDGNEAIAQPSMLVADAHDTGGLWRLGNEMPGCELAPIAAPPEDETLEIVDASSLSARVAFHSSSATRETALGANEHGLSLAIVTSAAEATTRTATFSLAVPPNAVLRTSSPAGSVERPLERVYTPTFWPSVGWVSVGGWTLLLRQSTGVRMSSPGQLEVMVARDARTEKCDVEGGSGSDTAVHRVEWRFERALSPADMERESQAFNRPIDVEVVDAAQPVVPSTLPAELSLARIDGDGIISAIKPAERGDGIIVRALLSGQAHVTPWSGWTGRSLTITDLVERDQRDRGTLGAQIDLDPATMGAIVSMRVR